VLLAGCPAPRVLPDIPRVEFKSFTLDEKTNPLGGKVLTGELVFDFEDGDGDIGFEAGYFGGGDTASQPDSTKYNLFLTMHEKVDGKYRMIDTSELESKPFYRIPPLDREGQNKTLRGEIKVDIEYFTIDYDTLKYSFYLMDRAFHRSNTDTTTEIIFTGWR
jgi:hypothetical protein